MRGKSNAKRRFFVPTLNTLEDRRLLTTPSVTFAGIDGSDGVGTGPSVGPDGLPDVHVVVSGLPLGTVLTALSATGPAVTDLPGFNWTMGPQGNATLAPNIVGHVRPTNPGDTTTTADIYLSPVVEKTDQSGTITLPPNSQLNLTMSYNSNNGPGTFSPQNIALTGLGQSNAEITPALPSVSKTSPYLISWGNQDSAGNAHLIISGLPANSTLQFATIGDVAGQSWTTGQYLTATYSSSTPQNTTSVDLAFRPARAEESAAATVTVQFWQAEADFIRGNASSLLGIPLIRRKRAFREVFSHGRLPTQPEPSTSSVRPSHSHDSPLVRQSCHALRSPSFRRSRRVKVCDCMRIVGAARVELAVAFFQEE